MNIIMAEASSELTNIFRNRRVKIVEYHEKKDNKLTYDVLRFYFHGTEQFLEFHPHELSKDDLMLVFKVERI